MEELQGTLENVIYQSDDGGFCVLRVKTAAGLVTVSRVRSTGARWIRGVSDGGRMSACMAQPP